MYIAADKLATHCLPYVPVQKDVVEDKGGASLRALSPIDATPASALRRLRRRVDVLALVAMPTRPPCVPLLTEIHTYRIATPKLIMEIVEPRTFLRRYVVVCQYETQLLLLHTDHHVDRLLRAAAR